MPSTNPLIAALRGFLKNAAANTATDVLRLAFQRRDTGALAFLELFCGLRHNRRTRRTLAQWEAEFSRRGPRHPAWYTRGLKTMWAVYASMKKEATSRGTKLPKNAKAQKLGRRMRRELTHSGLVERDLPNWKAEAAERMAAFYADLPGRQLVIWADNFYRRKYCTNPTRQDLSQNITAVAGLSLHEDAGLQASSTRSCRVPDSEDGFGPFWGLLGEKCWVSEFRLFGCFCDWAVSAV